MDNLMESSRLIQVLRSFSVSEMRRFIEFVHSPFFNKNQKVKRLVEFLATYYPKFSHADLDRKNVYAQIFPGSAFNHQRVRDLSSMALELAQDFLVQVHSRNKNSLRMNFLLKELNKRSLDRLFESRLKEARKLLSRTGFHDNYYYEQYSLLLAESEFRTRVYASNDKKLEKHFDSSGIVRALTSSYLFQVMAAYASWENTARKFNRSTDFERVEAELLQLKNKMAGEETILELYFLAIKMMMSGEEHYFTRLKEILCKKGFKGVVPDEQKGFLVMLANYCSDQIITGNYAYARHALDIYRTLLERNIFLQNGYMAHVFFTNVVVHSIYAGETSWLDSFILNYQKFLHPSVKESTISYCQAQLQFHKKNYRAVLRNLANSHNGSVYRELNIKALMLRTYYETGETESMHHLMDTYYHHLNSAEKVASGSKKAQGIFLKNVKTLIRLKRKKDRAALDSYMGSLAANARLLNRDWLMEKAEELDKVIENKE